jgi:hypothetical protein
MAKKPDFDTADAHKYFSVQCFNQAWDLIEKEDRTADEDEEMVCLTLASAWHWAQRPDCTPVNKSVGYWQTSHIYAILGQAGNAHRYAQLCLTASQGENIPPFYLGYAYEALARAEKAAGNQGKMDEYLGEAYHTAGQVKKDDDRKLLMDDLDKMTG